MSALDGGSVFDFTGKTVLITGGAGLLGAELAVGFLGHGANVMISDRDFDRAEQKATELSEQFGENVSAIDCDVTCQESTSKAVDACVARFGALDILMNNAAYVPGPSSEFFTSFEDYSLDLWREVMAVNIDGMFLMAQAAGRQMLKQGGGGVIIHTSSVYGVMAADNRIYEGSEYRGSAINNPAVYAASKSAVVGFSRWLATYWADKGIRVNTLAPGGIENGQNDVFQSKYSARVPMGRMAQAKEMVTTALYLAAPGSSYVTGQCVVVDGGLSAW